MPNFSVKDLEDLKRSGSEPSKVRTNVTHAMENSEKISADVRNIDPDTGQYEITVRGTLKREFLHGGSQMR